MVPRDAITPLMNISTRMLNMAYVDSGVSIIDCMPAASSGT
jgi:hypothetical protein